MQVVEQEQVERLEGDESSFSVDVSPGTSVEAEGLQEMLGDMADSFDVTGFKCVKCGLVHGHDTTKHRLGDSFDVSDEEAASMEFNSVCHCGVQEAGRHGSDLGIDEGRAASVAGNAPIPPEATRQMNESFGSL